MPDLTTDLVFLRSPAVSVQPLAGSRTRIGVWLRGDIPQARDMAHLFLNVAREQNLVIVPLSLQASRDRDIWPESADVRLLDAEREAVGTSALTDLDMVFSMRLHGCVLAALHGKPWMGIVYDPKVEGFARRLGWVYSVAPDDLDKERLLTTVRHFQACAADLEKTLRAKSGALHELSQTDMARCLASIEPLPPV